MTAPIARLTIDEIWYGHRRRRRYPATRVWVNGLLQPGEVQTVRDRDGRQPKMKANNWNFTHAKRRGQAAPLERWTAPTRKTRSPAAKAAAKKK